MIQIYNARTWLVGILIIVVSNAIALGGVAYNRSGKATSDLVLTERELRLPYRYGLATENSGIALRLDWRVFDSKKIHAYYSRWYPTEWLDANKLATLGFDVAYPLDKADSNEHYRKQLSREVLLVFEYDGPTYQKLLQQHQDAVAEAKILWQKNPDKKEFENRLKKATAKLQAEQNNNSRLFAIDAGVEYQTLRQQYADRQKYLIARGQVRLNYQGDYKKTPYLSGAIQQLSVAEVNVPRQHATVIQPLLEESTRYSDNQTPRYEVRLQFGQRYEPWVESLKRL